MTEETTKTPAVEPVKAPAPQMAKAPPERSMLTALTALIGKKVRIETHAGGIRNSRITSVESHDIGFILPGKPAMMVKSAEAVVLDGSFADQVAVHDIQRITLAE